MNSETVNVRYMVDDVQEAIDFYTENLGFTLIRARRRRSPTCDWERCGCC